MKTILGPLWSLYNNKDVFEIIVDSWQEVFYMHKDGAKDATKIFKTEAELEKVFSKLRSFGNDSDCFTLPDHTRISLVPPTHSLSGPGIVITKIPNKTIITLDDLIKFKALTAEGKTILQSVADGNQGFLVAGNMGSGRTTLMNVLIDQIQQPYRVVTLERHPDLILNRKKTLRLKAPHQKAAEMLELVQMAERLRCDFVILSECTGPEVMPFLDLCRTSTNGAILLKGENSVDALKFLETKAVLSSEGLSLEDVRYAIAQAFKHIVFQERGKDGKRMVSHIAQISYESGELRLKTLYKP